jgi:hypothetical protein
MNAIIGFGLLIKNINAFYMCGKSQRKPGQRGGALGERQRQLAVTAHISVIFALSMIDMTSSLTAGFPCRPAVRRGKYRRLTTGRPILRRLAAARP